MYNLEIMWLCSCQCHLVESEEGGTILPGNILLIGI